MADINGQYARLNPQPHELVWVTCAKCSESVPAVNVSTLEPGVCRSCSYGDMRRLADIPNKVAVIAAVIRYRNRSMMGAKAAAFRHDKIMGGDA